MGTAIGQRLPKLDAPAKATGRAVYGHDVRLPGMLHGRILYAKYHHARILGVDVSQAAKLAGVKAIVTAADNPKTKFGYGKDNTPLKGDVARSLRDEIAAVAAVDADTAEEALELIRVESEPLPAVFDAGSALQEGAPLVHPEHGSNLFQTYHYAHGDPERGERESDVVVEADYDLPYVAHAAMETSVVVASFDLGGRLTLYSTTQIPFLLQRDLSEALGMDGSDIRIIQTAIGGAFGRGLDIYPYEPIAALLARQAGKPVRVSFSRHEEFLAAPMRQPALIHARAGAKRDGKITFRDAYALLDVGAYISWGSVTPLVMMETTASLYRVPHVKFQADCVYTNNLITGAMRGYGNPQSTFFVETMMDRLAEALRMDPVEFRIRNANIPNSETPQGLVITSCGMKECLETVAATADQGVRHKTYIPFSDTTTAINHPLAAKTSHHLKRGIGFATTLNVGGGARIYRSDGCGATVKVDDFGHVTLVTGSTEIGQGSETVLAQIVAQTLGARMEDVTVLNSDTDVKPWDVGVHASRTTFIAGNAAHLAALDVRNQVFETAAELLKAKPEELQSNNGNVTVKDDPKLSVTIAQAARSRHFKEGGKVILGEGW